MKILRFLIKCLKDPASYAGIGVALTQAPDFPHRGELIAALGVVAFLVNRAENQPAPAPAQ